MKKGKCMGQIANKAFADLISKIAEWLKNLGKNKSSGGGGGKKF